MGQNSFSKNCAFHGFSLKRLYIHTHTWHAPEKEKKEARRRRGCTEFIKDIRILRVLAASPTGRRSHHPHPVRPSARPCSVLALRGASRRQSWHRASQQLPGKPGSEVPGGAAAAARRQRIQVRRGHERCLSLFPPAITSPAVIFLLQLADRRLIIVVIGFNPT